MASVPSPKILQFAVQSRSMSANYLLFSSPSQPWPCSQKLRNASLFPIIVKVSSKVKCLTESTDEDRLSESEAVDDDVDGVREDTKVHVKRPQRTASSSSDSLSLGIREPVYEVFFFFLILKNFQDAFNRVCLVNYASCKALCKNFLESTFQVLLRKALFFFFFFLPLHYKHY